jgi:hypothetical protein
VKGLEEEGEETSSMICHPPDSEVSESEEEEEINSTASETQTSPSCHTVACEVPESKEAASRICSTEASEPSKSEETASQVRNTEASEPSESEESEAPKICHLPNFLPPEIRNIIYAYALYENELDDDDDDDDDDLNDAASTQAENGDEESEGEAEAKVGSEDEKDEWQNIEPDRGFITIDPLSTTTSSSSSSSWQPPALLQTCRQIRLEASGIFYMQTDFQLELYDFDHTPLVLFHSSLHRVGFPDALVEWTVSGRKDWPNLLAWCKAVFEARCPALLDDRSGWFTTAEMQAEQETAVAFHAQSLALEFRLNHGKRYGWARCERGPLERLRRTLAVLDEGWREEFSTGVVGRDGWRRRRS